MTNASPCVELSTISGAVPGRLGIGPAHERILASLFSLPVASACADAAESVAPNWLEREPWFQQAASSRQHELAAGRACASRVLAALGVEPVPVARGAEGEPVWPSGVVGSISHSEGLCAAVGASASDVGAIGLDIEPDRLETAAFAQRICNPAELAAIGGLGEPIVALAPVVFAAKEASYKLQFPLTRDAAAWGRLEVLLSADMFTVRFAGAQGPLANGLICGRWRRALGFIWAGVTLRW